MGSKKKSVDKYSSPLSLVERLLYLIVTSCTIFYICYSVFKDSVKYDGILNMYDFDTGWFWLGREQDISNFEWRFWYGMFWRVWPWYFGHIALGKIMEWHSPSKRKYVFLVYSLLSISLLVGWRPVILFLAHSATLYLTSVLGFTVLVWIVSLASLSTLNFQPFVSLMKSMIEDDDEETWYYLLMFTLALLNIKGTSFCLEKCWHMKEQSQKPDTAPQYPSDIYNQLKPETSMCSETENQQENVVNQVDKIGNQVDKGGNQVEEVGFSFVDHLSYVFYLPLYFTGPILTYDLYRKQMNAPLTFNTGPRLKIVMLHLVRFCFWAMFNEFILHFLYFNALQHNYTVLRSVSLFTLAGLGYCHGQFFMIKYLVMFGLPGTIAKFDYLEPPDGPKCISYIYLYSDMWKYFDRGLYSFLKRYIYVPCGGSKEGLHRQIIGSLLCFMYIFYWHGAEYYILLWILLNYAGVSLEKIGSVISSVSFIKHLETDVLSAGMVQRIHAIFSIPIFLISCFSMFCFFGGKSVGYIFFRRLILEGTIESFAVLTFLVYCAIQNGIEVNRWTLKRDRLKQS